MIQSKEDYKYYLACDKAALGITRKRPKFMHDHIWRFERALRRCEYLANCKNGGGYFLLRKIANVRYLQLGIKCGFEIPLNVFGPGLCLVHYGTVVVAGGARIGKNCRIHEGVTIGATNGSKDAAIIGDNVFIASGAKIIGKVVISDNVAIGANAVVVKDIICDNGCTVGGIPAKIISNNNSSLNIPKNIIES